MYSLIKFKLYIYLFMDLNNQTKNELSPKRYIEVIYQNSKDNTIWLLSDFLEWSIYENKKDNILKQLEDILQIINKTDWTVKEKYKYQKRDTWKRYLDHVRNVRSIYVEKLSTLKENLKNLDKSNKEHVKKAITLVKLEIYMIATCQDHDSIEDTDVTFEWLRQTSWDIIAFSTLLLSKKPFTEFINNEDDLNELKEIAKTWILNSKWLISDNFKKKLYIEKYIDDEVEKISILDNYDITEVERNWLERHKILEKKYKKARNNHYFNNFKSKESLIEYATNLSKELNLNFNIEQIKLIICRITLIKIADRIDNLSDISEAWKNEPNRIIKKLNETEEYLLPLAREINFIIFEEISREIFKIRENITKLEISNKIEKIL